MARTDFQSSKQSTTERLFKVKAEVRVPRMGSHYILRAGKVISSKGYDVDELLRQGVQLEEIAAPAASA